MAGGISIVVFGFILIWYGGQYGEKVEEYIFAGTALY